MDYKLLFNEGESLEANLIIERGGEISMPAVSIIIPTYNRPKLLAHALQSALNQAFDHAYEIVVIDNCSDEICADTIRATISGLKIPSQCFVRLFRCPSYSNSWNMGIVKARSPYIVMLHDDDLLQGNHLQTTFNIAKRDPNIDVVSSDSIILMETDVLTRSNKLYASVKEMIKKVRTNRLIRLKPSDFYYENPAPNTGIFFKRSLAIEMGGFNFKYAPIPDYIFLYNVAKEHHNIYYLNQKISSIRFSVNDGLKKETNLNVKSSIDKLRHDIRINNPSLRYLDGGYFKLSILLTKLEYKSNPSFGVKLQILLIRIYTRIISLFDFIFRILF